MSRWVDAEYCEDFFDRWESRVKNAEPVTIDVVQNTRTLLRDAPSIDIVRCGECKWLRYCETEEMEQTLDCDHPDGGGIPRSEEWFCADGERKGQV
jgi:hypothetical protein